MYSNKKHIFVLSEVLMKQLIFFVFFTIFSAQVISAQGPPNGERPDSEGTESEGNFNRKFSKTKEKQKRAPINSYKIISIERDTTYLDTSLSIHKEYKFNYLRKDAFELESNVNIGSTYTQLTKQKAHFDVAPQFGATARHIGYLEAEDINYYQAATPLTELYYKTALEQGQQFDGFITINTSPNLNFSLAYKGVRSLGAYQNSLTSTKSFRGTISYFTPNKRYIANGHFTDQRLLNEENGGLSDLGLNDFTTISDESDDRTILSVNFENAENLLNGKRYFLDHEFRISKPDSLGNGKLAVGHQIEYTNKKYYFEQSDTEEGFFGTAQSETDFLDRVELNLLQNKVSLSYKNKYLGALGFFARHTFYNYGYDNVFIAEDSEEDVTNRLIDDVISLGASYKNTYKGFLLEGNAESVISGEFSNQHFLGTAGYDYKDKLALKFGYELKSEAQSFNKLLYQSNYTDYLWQNDFDNTLTNTFSVDLSAKNGFSVNAEYSIIDDYAYFERIQASPEDDDIADGDVQLIESGDNIGDVRLDNNNDFIPTGRVSNPVQTSGTINVLKIKAFKEFSFGNFRLANTFMYQNVDGNDDVYNVPEFTTRNSLYYENVVFKKAMFLQAGFTFKYFSNFFADGYDPLLADYFVQNEQEIGDFPQLDFFLNTKIRQTRIFFKLENMQGLIDQNNDLVAPNYPSRDFLVRFGLVWNFFL